VKVRYEDVKWFFHTAHYDVHWRGYGWYQDKFYSIQTIDETDYDTMTDSCPCCKDGGTDNWKDCHCENMPELFCELKEMSIWQIVAMLIEKKYWEWIKRPYLFWKFKRKMNK
jgi:hypothetical protein